MSKTKTIFSDSTQQTLPLMPLREVVMFPQSVMPLFVGRDSSIKAIETALSGYDKHICLITQCDPDMEKPKTKDLFSIGVVSKILQILRLPDGTVKVLFEGLERVTWAPIADDPLFPFGKQAYPLVCVQQMPLVHIEKTSESEALLRATHTALEDFAKNNKKITQDILNNLLSLNDPGTLSDGIVNYLRSNYMAKQAILEEPEPFMRLERVYESLQGELAVVSMEKRIKTRVRNQMEHNQREYYLSEQLRAIHKEMGRDDDPQNEYDELEAKLNEKNMPAEAREKGLHELKKIRQMAPSSSEYTVLRTYIDWLLDLPWNDVKEIAIDLDEAKVILDTDHYGMEKPKERILEYLAVQKLNGMKAPILCLVGPPGVGKTSLARSVAKATGREYIRLSLGGVRDEAEIRGHRRTYVGALPGKFISALKRAKYSNPLFCLDEIDKMSADFRGDPASAMLEVLDPEQNCTFSDHYLDLDYDLSQIFFITTANSLHSIPVPLQDRMEIIQLASYLDVEKKHIAKEFLLPKQVEKHGLKPENIRLSDNALSEIIRSYTREAGVRNLERELAALCRKTAVKLVESKAMDQRVHITRQNLESFLGIKKYRENEYEHKNRVGVVNGLAYTGVGGDVLEVEAVIMPGKGKVTTTGKVGEVMNESAKAAMSFVRAHSHQLGLKDDFHDRIDIHLHFPAGATPKDGPSAGVAIITCLTSALLGVPVRYDIAMTGEVSLSGRILPIGGLREKLLAATRNSIKQVLIPRENHKDLKEVPEEILKQLDVQLIDHVRDVLNIALVTPVGNLIDSELYMPMIVSLRQEAPPSDTIAAQ